MSKLLEERKNDLITRAEEVLNTAKAEKRELTEAEAAELAEIRDDVKAIKKTLGLEDDFKDILDEESERKEEKEMNENTETRALDEERSFEMYIRGTLNERNDYDMVKTNNGAIIPASVANKIIKKIFEVSPIIAKADRYNVKGKLTIPYYNEASHAISVGFVTEGTAPDASSGDFTSITLNGYLAGAIAKIGKDLIANTEFDVVAFVVNDMAEKLARFIEKEIIAPSDASNKVKGLSTIPAGQTVTTASTSVITSDDVVKVRDKVKDAFQQNAIWVMSPSTRTALRLLQDDKGHYLLNDDISSPFGTTLLGKPVYVSENVENIAASKNVIFYGDFKGLALKLSQDIDVQVLREAYAGQFCVGVVGTVDFDAVVENEQALAKLVMAAS